MTVTPEASLRGKLVRLRPRTYDDIPLFVAWYGDPDVRHWLHMSETAVPTFETERIRYEMSERDSTRLMWMIETLDGTPIGNVGLVALDDTHQRGELGIGIGEKLQWGRGYGTDAIRVLLRFAFEKMALRRITLITDADNERGIRCYEKAGFVSEGILQGHRLRYGVPIDMLTMAVLRDTWEG